MTCSRRTIPFTIRLPNDVLETIARRAKRQNISAHSYLRDRIVYDIRRKHKKDKEIPQKVSPP